MSQAKLKTRTPHSALRLFSSAPFSTPCSAHSAATSPPPPTPPKTQSSPTSNTPLYGRCAADDKSRLKMATANGQANINAVRQMTGSLPGSSSICRWCSTRFSTMPLPKPAHGERNQIAESRSAPAIPNSATATTRPAGVCVSNDKIESNTSARDETDRHRNQPEQ